MASTARLALTCGSAQHAAVCVLGGRAAAGHRRSHRRGARRRRLLPPRQRSSPGSFCISSWLCYRRRRAACHQVQVTTSVPISRAESEQSGCRFKTTLRPNRPQRCHNGGADGSDARDLPMYRCACLGGKVMFSQILATWGWTSSAGGGVTVLKHKASTLSLTALVLKSATHSVLDVDGYCSPPLAQMIANPI